MYSSKLHKEAISKGIVKSTVFKGTKHKSKYFEAYVDAYVKAGISKDEAERILADYNSIDEQDAQGYITLDEYRQMMIRIGDWTSKHAQLYERIRFGQELNPEDMFFFQPLKAQYFGPDATEYNKPVEERLNVPMYYKFSLMPLVSSMLNRETNGKREKTVLGELAQKMEEQGVGMALFDSANKVGMRTGQNFYKQENEELSPAFRGGNELKEQWVDYRFLGIQLDIAPKVKTENTDATQQRKLIFANQAEDGVWNEITVEGKKDKVSVGKLKEEYDEIYAKIVAKKREKLLKDLGIKEGEFTIENVENLLTLLREEAEGKNAPDNIIDSLQGKVVNGKVELPQGFDANLNRNKIENILFSLVNNRLVKLKRKGGAKIQGSSVGFEVGKRSLKEDQTGYLKFYTPNEEQPTGVAEIMIGLPKELIPLSKKYGGVKGLNAAIAKGEVDEKILTYYCYRIPCQDFNSIDVFRVKEFLSPEVGELVIVPSEIVVKTGSDFDVDKLNIFQPYLKEDKDKGIIYDKDHLENKLLEIQKDIILAPENFTLLVEPISAQVLKDRADELRKKSGTSLERASAKNQLRYSNVLQKGKDFWGGKTGVGLSALYRTFQTILQQVGASYKEYDRPIYETNKSADGRVSLSKKNNVDGKSIGGVVSMFINAYVDIARDPFVFELNAGTDNAPLYFKMILEGASLDWSTAYMNQPVIRALNEQTAKNKSIFLRERGNNKRKDKVQEELWNTYAKAYARLGKPLYTFAKREEVQRERPTTEQLENYIEWARDINNKTKEEQIKFYETQLLVLSTYLDYSAQAQELGDVQKSLQDDTSGAGKDFAMADGFLRLKNEVAARELLTNIDKAYGTTDKPTFLGTFAENAAKLATVMYNQLFLTRQPNYRQVLDSIRADINLVPFRKDEKQQLETKLINDFLQFVVQYREPNFYNPLIQDETGRVLVRDLFMGENSVASRIQRFKENPNYAENPLIKSLYPEMNTEDRGWDSVKLFTKRMTTYEANSMTSAFRELYDINPSFALDLARVAILQGGLNNSHITFINLVPYEIYQQLTQPQFDLFKSGNANTTSFIDKFYRNNLKNKLLVPVRKANEPIGNRAYIKKKTGRKEYTYYQVVGETLQPVTQLGNSYRYGEYWTSKSILPAKGSKPDKPKVEDNTKQVEDFIKNCKGTK
jgi:hypothetical protein